VRPHRNVLCHGDALVRTMGMQEAGHHGSDSSPTPSSCNIWGPRGWLLFTGFGQPSTTATQPYTMDEPIGVVDPMCGCGLIRASQQTRARGDIRAWVDPVQLKLSSSRTSPNRRLLADFYPIASSSFFVSVSPRSLTALPGEAPSDGRASRSRSVGRIIIFPAEPCASIRALVLGQGVRLANHMPSSPWSARRTTRTSRRRLRFPSLCLLCQRIPTCSNDVVIRHMYHHHWCPLCDETC
jgi:hypothetical protein